MLDYPGFFQKLRPNPIMCSGESELNSYLQKYPFECEFEETWPTQGNMRVRIALAQELPPQNVSSSVMAVVVQPGQQVLCLYPDERSGNIAQFLVGGRQQNEETEEETVIREVKEETGWLIEPIGMIGFRHFHHLDPRSDRTDRPYPDFIQPIFSSKAIHRNTSDIIQEDAIPCRMIDFILARSMLSEEQHFLLAAAMNKAVSDRIS